MSADNDPSEIPEAEARSLPRGKRTGELLFVIAIGLIIAHMAVAIFVAPRLEAMFMDIGHDNLPIFTRLLLKVLPYGWAAALYALAMAYALKRLKRWTMLRIFILGLWMLFVAVIVALFMPLLGTSDLRTMPK